MDKLFVNPSFDEIYQSMDRELTRVNKGARTRLAEPCTDGCLEAFNAIQRNDAGVFRYGGQGVCNSYRNRAYTTVIGVVFWTGPYNTKFVRLRVERVDAPKSPYGQRMAKIFPEITNKELFSRAHCFELIKTKIGEIE